jgi:hypothetical protein
MRHLYEGPEALEWLKRNSNPAALASNRFNSREEAIAFVESLYAAGADHVVVFKETIMNDQATIQGEGGPYADTLVVTLPSDAGKRRRVVALCSPEVAREGVTLDDAIDGDYLVLFWD